MTTPGALVKKFRGRRGWSRKEFAARSGVSSSYIARFENNAPKTNLSDQKIDQLLGALALNPSEQTEMNAARRGDLPPSEVDDLRCHLDRQFEQIVVALNTNAAVTRGALEQLTRAFNDIARRSR